MTFLVGMVCGYVLMPEWIRRCTAPVWSLVLGCGVNKNKKYLISTTGERASATFWGPFDKTQEPYIRIAVDDYEDILESFGKDNALAAILGSMAHELSHYFQWLKDLDIMDAKMERQAKYYSDVIVWDYAETREHP